jgi:hypothetical protein
MPDRYGARAGSATKIERETTEAAGDTGQAQQENATHARGRPHGWRPASHPSPLERPGVGIARLVFLGRDVMPAHGDYTSPELLWCAGWVRDQNRRRNNGSGRTCRPAAARGMPPQANCRRWAGRAVGEPTSRRKVGDAGTLAARRAEPDLAGGSSCVTLPSNLLMRYWSHRFPGALQRMEAPK